MQLEIGEQIIWKEFPMSKYRRDATIGLIIIGVIFLLTVFLAGVGVMLIILLGLALYFILRSANQYVVTNKRALHLRFGRVIKEVPLNTPNLLISTVNTQYIQSRLAGQHIVQDIVFLQNGVELLRFNKVHKGDELIAKLKSMGFISA
ncbi:hypothetical protein EWF20_00610 [Sulfolobus sp. S-194]|uniref:hypothetical protein n=1 Tax=Sulfolobus sp. S-194 TaxID=2512240 RepID=UPI0014370C2D|nr:hypothetical protein [Sulfolobus sp. S-194]QIW22806.1 hypothetical protein EWF20_00610 [Sulfolobus sp. S-194]